MMKNLLKLLILGTTSLASSLSTAGSAPPAFKKVMIIVLENEDAESVLSNPTFKAFAESGAYLSNLNAEVHPSQANYIALISGDTHGTEGDRSIDIDARHIGDLLEATGHTWKTYLEGYPGNCFKGAQKGDYVRKHNPFISFKNIQGDRERCLKHLVNASELDKDISAGTIPDFSLYVPDLQNDGHDTDIAYSARWFSRTFGPRMKDPRFTRDMAVILTFDESELTGGNLIYGAIAGDSVIPGSKSGKRYDHYSILRTIQDAFGLGSFGRNDQTATPISEIWR